MANTTAGVKRSGDRITVIAIIIVALVVVMVWFFWQYEYVEKTVDGGPAQEVLRNPWHAATRFLEAKGYALVVDDRLDRLEQLDGFSTLIVSRDDFLLTRESFRRVMKWVSEGGHLIIGFADEEGFLAQSLHLSEDYYSSKNLKPFLTDAERVHEEKAHEAAAQGEIADDAAHQHAMVIDEQDDSAQRKDQASAEDQAANAEQGCTLERYRADNCRLTKLSERMRAENAAAKAEFEARQARIAAGEATAATHSVPPEQAWVLDYLNANKYTRTYVHFNGDLFRTYVDWNTHRTLVYSPPEGEDQTQASDAQVPDRDTAYTGDSAQNSAEQAGLDSPNVTLVAEVGNDRLTHFLQFEADKGTISVLINTEIWENDRIGRLDHAYFLWALAGDLSAPMAILHGRQVPPLLALVLKYLPELLVSSLCLLLVHFLRHGWRFGPRILPTYGVRRSLLEHVVASGVFLWGQQAQETLLDPLRRAVLHQLCVRMGHGFDVRAPEDWARIYPGLLPKLNTGDQAALRAALQGPDSASVSSGRPDTAKIQSDASRQKSSVAQAPLSAAEFYRQVRLLQILRKVL